MSVSLTCEGTEAQRCTAASLSLSPRSARRAWVTRHANTQESQYRTYISKQTRTSPNPAAPRARVYTARRDYPIVLAVTLATTDAEFWDKAYNLAVAAARVYALLLMVVLAACLGACASVAVDEVRKHRAEKERRAAEAAARKQT